MKLAFSKSSTRSLAGAAASNVAAQIKHALERARSIFQNRPARQLHVRETLAIGEKRQLLIVECGTRRMLIGVAGNFVAMLAELPALEGGGTCE